MCNCSPRMMHHCVQFRLDRSTDGYISPISRSINAYSLGYEATRFCVHYAMPTDGSWVCQITGELLPQSRNSTRCDRAMAETMEKKKSVRWHSNDILIW